MMTFLTNILMICFALIGVLVAVALIYDRFRCNRHADTTVPTTNPYPVLPLQLYGPVGQALCECVDANHFACGLCRPQHLAQHIAVDGSGIRMGGSTFVYWFDRKVFHLGGIHQTAFSSVPVAKMAQILNQTLPNYCGAYGLPPLQIISQQDESNGRVAFMLAQKEVTAV